MPELRKDPVTGNWVIISTERKKRPQYYQIVVDKDISSPENCPFCPNNEELTPPEILAVRPDRSPANRPGWELRVVPNKFPALRIEGELDRTGEGMYDKMNGIGAHEVLIETPLHTQPFASLPTEHLAHVLGAIRSRILDLKNDIRFQYIMVFKNFGPTAGATMSHSHTQLIALPVVPSRLQAELEGARRHYRQKERCIFCDIIRAEVETSSRLLLENESFVAMAPYAPRFPFELVIYPRRHAPSFEQGSDAEFHLLAMIMKEMLSRVNRILGSPDYNIMVHNAPFSGDVADHFHWHIEFMPVLSRVAGFEWGTGFHINPVPPEESVQALKLV